MRAPLIFALVLSTALKLWLAFIVPVGTAEVPGKLSSYNDELAHIHYVRHLLETRSLPKQIEPIDAPGALERAQFENFQPPLYYALVAAACKVTRAGSDLQIAKVGRLCNLALSLLCIIVAWQFGRVLNLPETTLNGFAIATVLNGCFIRFGSTTTNDMLLWLFAGLFLLALLKTTQRPDDPFHYVLLFALTAAFYTKASALILLFLLPIIAVTVLRSGLVRATIMAVIALLLSLPVWLHNVFEFHELVPLAAGFGAASFTLPDSGTMLYALRSFFNPFQESWTGLPDLVLVIPLLAGLLDVPTLWQKLSHNSRFLLLSALGLSIFAYLLLNIRYEQAEAKYLFVAWPALLLLFTGTPRQVAWKNWYVLAASMLPLAPLVRLLGDR